MKTQYIKQLMDQALAAGMTAGEAYVAAGSSFSAMAHGGEIVDYQVNTTKGLCFRGLFQGKMGYASTEAMDEASIQELIDGVKESAMLSEEEAVEVIYPGDKAYPEFNAYAKDLDSVTGEEKITLCLALEKAGLAIDPRVRQIDHSTVSTESASIHIVNTYGLDIQYQDNSCVAYMQPVVTEDGDTDVGFKVECGRDFSKLDSQKIAEEAVGEALLALHGKPVASGNYRTIIRWDAMRDLLRTFSGIFSAENTQKDLSMLKGKEGESIAAPCITLMDDPLLVGGFASCPFDAEGVASKSKAVIENGVLKTLLHNLKTAKKQGVATTGNASKAGYTAPVRVAPTNFFLQPGSKSLEDMMGDLGDGLVITDVSGLHSGANPISGDFSLLAKGYTVKNGKRERPVAQITIAGNFYTLLKNIQTVGSDLNFPGSGVGSPSVDAGIVAVAGN